MVEMLYNFIRHTLIGTTTMQDADLLAIILTALSIFLIFGALVRFVKWLFFAPFRGNQWRK